jgi:hypothetical protein
MITYVAETDILEFSGDKIVYESVGGKVRRMRCEPHIDLEIFQSQNGFHYGYFATARHTSGSPVQIILMRCASIEGYWLGVLQAEDVGLYYTHFDSRDELLTHARIFYINYLRNTDWKIGGLY